LYRVFINLIKNSEDSISEKREKNIGFKGKISVEINENNDYITITLIDNGIGVKDLNKIMTPYYTTKTDGTGLGLPIVKKIINEHFGDIVISNNKPGAKILITLPKIII
jgi:two-component system nitrogen regulation sensor histidine kinase NtrY